MKPRQLRLLLIVGLAAMIIAVLAFIWMSQLMQQVNERKERADRANAVLGTLTWDDILAEGDAASASASAEPSEAASAGLESSGEASALQTAEPTATATATLAPSARPTVMAGGGLIPYDNRKFVVSEGAVPEAGFAKVITVTRKDRPLIAQDITWEMDVRDSDDVHVTISGRRLSDKENIATGTLVELYDGDQIVDTGIIVVPGDLNGSGTIDASQIAIMKKAIEDPSSLEGVYLLAADMDGSGDVDEADLVLLQERIGAGEE